MNLTQDVLKVDVHVLMYSMKYHISYICFFCEFVSSHTVDGRNPAPVDVPVVDIPVFIGFYTSQVVQAFFHQQYHPYSMWSRSSNIQPPFVRMNGEALEEPGSVPLSSS